MPGTHAQIHNIPPQKQKSPTQKQKMHPLLKGCIQINYMQ